MGMLIFLSLLIGVVIAFYGIGERYFPEELKRIASSIMDEKE